MPSLFVIKGGDQGKLFDVEEGTLGIGRDPSNHLQVHDTEVSRRHAELRYDGAHCIVADLGSSNGTYVNGTRLEGERQLSTSDKLQVGGTLMLFTDPEEQLPDDLSDQIDIVPRGAAENSRIVRSMSQEAGSQLLDFDLGEGSQPLAGPGPQQFAGHVSHGAGREPHAGHRPVAQPHHGVDLRVGRSRPRLHHAAGPSRPRTLEPKVRRDRQGIDTAERHHDQQDDSRLRACSTTKAC